MIGDNIGGKMINDFERVVVGKLDIFDRNTQLLLSKSATPHSSRISIPVNDITQMILLLL